MDTNRALILCDKGKNQERVVTAALKCALNPICCATLEEARRLLFQEDFRIVVCDDVLPDGDFSGTLREVRKYSPHTPFIVLLHTMDWEAYLKTLGAGAFDSIICPPTPVEVERILWCALSDTARAPAAA